MSHSAFSRLFTQLMFTGYCVLAPLSCQSLIDSDYKKERNGVHRSFALTYSSRGQRKTCPSHSNPSTHWFFLYAKSYPVSIVFVRRIISILRSSRNLQAVTHMNEKMEVHPNWSQLTIFFKKAVIFLLICQNLVSIKMSTPLSTLLQLRLMTKIKYKVKCLVPFSSS